MTTATLTLSANDVVRSAVRYRDRLRDAEAWALSAPYDRWSDPAAQRAYVALFNRVRFRAAGPNRVVATLNGRDRAARFHADGILGAVLDCPDITLPDSALITVERGKATLTW